MERNTLLVLGAITVAVVAAGAFATFGTVGAQEQGPAGNQTIAVDGSGTVDATPDRALVRTSVAVEGESPADVRDKLASGAADLEAALDELGVEYETTNYNVRQTHDHEERDVARYRGVHAYEVTVDDLDMTGEVIDAAANTNAEIGGISLTLSDETRKEIREQAIEAAMDDARSQAETLAESSGLEIAGATSIDASAGDVRPVPVRYEDADGGDGAAAPPTTIQTGDVTVRYSVSVVYEATQ
ncbi:SIMPL domain-containing protein [Halovenus marina]|uniref:SIMPL domain-containing protein n=1 Tax=Halovenus marina TaxID=3396621 RepID=UPI003F5708BC